MLFACDFYHIVVLNFSNYIVLNNLPHLYAKLLSVFCGHNCVQLQDHTLLYSATSVSLSLRNLSRLILLTWLDSFEEFANAVLQVSQFEFIYLFIYFGEVRLT